jgi:hypothetical protein
MRWVGLVVLAAGGVSANDAPDELLTFRPTLDFHPIGYTLRGPGAVVAGPVRMRPAGFPSDVYNFYVSPSVRLPGGWMLATGLTGAQAEGPAGNALFYGLGLQKQLVQGRGLRPGIAIGGYGYLGPNDHHGGTVYAVATQRLMGGHQESRSGLFAHAGLKVESFSSRGLDGTGARPFFGSSLSYRRRYFLSAEISPAQPWERSTQFSLRSTAVLFPQVRVLGGRNPIKLDVGITGGVQNNGYRTTPFIGPNVAGSL